jgi:hypothetical protein
VPTPFTAYLSPKFAEELNRELGAAGYDDYRKLHGKTIDGIKIEIADTAPTGQIYMKHKDEEE